MTDTQTLAYLVAERGRHPELDELIDLHIAVLQARSEVKVDSPQILEGQARERLERGEPLLKIAELTLDWAAFAELFQSICEAVARTAPARANDLLAVSNLASTPEAAARLARASLEERPGDPLVTFVLNNTLHPFLAAWAQAYAQNAQEFFSDETWYRSFCPVCGGAPDLAVLQKASGGRRLVCSRCDFEWSFHRSLCPFCGAEGEQGYFPDGLGAYRLYACGKCRRYLKTIDLRELARGVDLPGERILTLGMDMAARAAGYLS